MLLITGDELLQMKTWFFGCVLSINLGGLLNEKNDINRLTGYQYVCTSQ